MAVGAVDGVDVDGEDVVAGEDVVGVNVGVTVGSIVGTVLGTVDGVTDGVIISVNDGSEVVDGEGLGVEVGCADGWFEG